MKFTVLGSGDAFCSGGNYHSNYLLHLAEHTIMVDCGATVLLALQHSQVLPNQLDAIVLTHLHGDHYGGLPFLLISDLYHHCRTKPLTIWGPPGTREKARQLTELLYPGVWKTAQRLPIYWKEYTSEQTEVSNWGNFTALPVKHSQASQPHGLRFTAEDKVVAFSGDTAWHPNLIKLAQEADCFICECNFYRLSTAGHLNYLELEQKLPKLMARQIWLTHLGTEMLHHQDRVKVPRLAAGQVLEI